MAFTMVTGAVLPVSLLVMLLVASQWTSVHARSMPGDDDSHDTQQFHAPTYGGYQALNPDQAEYQPSFFDTQSDVPSFVGQGNSWDADSFTYQDIVHSKPTQQNTYNYAGTSFASTETEPPFDTFVDSPETVQDTPASFADHTTATQNQEVHTQAEYDNDQVFFDTSDATTVYRAGDGGLTLSALDVMNATRADDMLATLAEAMGGCGTGNPIDDCWRCDPNWRSHRQALASCAIGFGRNAIGGKNGPIYTVTDNVDDLANPQPGTLRYGVTRDGPLWIVFDKDMTIQLRGELWVTAFKTIDGRGAQVHLTGASQITVQSTNNVILHGLHIHDIKPSGPATIRVSPTKAVKRGKTDGDAVHIWGSHDVWVDHCYLARATDGLLDVTRGSTAVTVSNNLFEQHDKTMLLGADPSHTMDVNMKVTVAFNKFGKALVQRLPRCRFGVFHVLNNDYSAGWSMYAIGGSEDPTILSQGNYFSPSGNKEVTKRIDDNGPALGGWQSWNWASSGDVFLNGAFFVGSGAKATTSSVYAKAFSTSSRPGSMVPALTKAAGPVTV